MCAQDIKAWLSWLRSDVGFDGWRFDFVKGYGGHHVREYIEATDPALAVGEFWDDCAYTDSKIDFDQVRTNHCPRSANPANYWNTSLHPTCMIHAYQTHWVDVFRIPESLCLLINVCLCPIACEEFYCVSGHV